MIWMVLFLVWSGDNGDKDVDWAERQFKSHIRFLASDALQGRDTTFPGQKTAAEYIAAHFRSHDIPPAYPNTEDEYLQSYELSVTETDPASLSLKVRGRGESLSLVHGRDYSFFSPRLSNFSDRAPLTFVGFGLENDDYNDFGGVDIEGHWAVMFEGRPNGKGPLFKEDKISGGRFWEKIMKVLSRGGKGVIVLVDDEYEGYDNGRSQSSMAFPGQSESSGECFPIIRIPANKAEAFLGKYAKRVEKARKMIEEKEKPQSFVLKARTLDFTVRYEKTIKKAENVIAVLPGDDPVLKDEYVVVSAHYDHVGVQGREVYNGADDNASGTATIMLLGQRFRQIPHRRSLILLLVSGEEHGLLGSEHFVKNPNVPHEQIVANINFDMVGRPEKGLGVIPSKNDDVTSLNDLLMQINQDKNYNIALRDDMDRYHSRSDHYNFVENGIPAIFFFSGMHDDYHEPTDDWDKIQYKDLAQSYFLFEEFAQAVMNADERPTWKKDRKKEGDHSEDDDKKTSPGQ